MSSLRSLPLLCRGKSIALDIVRGIYVLHEQYNVAHLDIKTPNILLTSDQMHARVADFGLGRVMDLHGRRLESNVPGTFAWAAPEQIDVSVLRLWGFSLTAVLHDLGVKQLALDCNKNL